MPPKASRGGKRGTRGKKVPRRPALITQPQTEESSTEQPLAQISSVELSTHLVQTSVAAIFYQILKTRHVFRKHPWQERVFHPDDPNNSFDAYVNGTDFVPPPNRLFVWYVPKRGEDEQVDKLMSVLESCTKEPIEKGYLKKLQLCFHTSDEHAVSESNLIESYCLTFEYENGKPSSQLSQRVRGQDTQEITTLIVSEGRQKLIDMVEKLLQFLYASDRSGRLKQYPLPDEYRLNILAEYNDSAPPDYQARYFKPGDTDTVALLNLCNSSNDYVMTTDHHRVSAGILLPGSPGSPAPRQQPPGHGTNVEKSPASSSGLPSHRDTQQSSQHSQQRERRLRLSSIVGDGTQREAISQLNGVGTSRTPNAATQDTQQLEQHVLPSQQPKEARSEPIRAPSYTQHILDYMNSRLAEYADSIDDDLDGPQGIGHEGYHDVNCECDCKDDGGNMIKCVQCRGLQHSECYGYLDDVQPLHHLCYSCLSEIYPEDKQQLRNAANLCVLRLALRFLRDKQVPVTYTDLADYLGRSIESTNEITEVLEQSGLVQSNDRFVKYAGNDEILRREYFQPQKHINNLFSLPNSSSVNLLDLNESGASFRTPSRSHNAVLRAKVSSRTHILDDGTTQGEPSPHSSSRHTFLNDEAQSLQNVVRRGLDLNFMESSPPALKRFSEFESPSQSLKRQRVSRASPFAFQSTISS